MMLKYPRMMLKYHRMMLKYQRMMLKQPSTREIEYKCRNRYFGAVVEALGYLIRYGPIIARGILSIKLHLQRDEDFLFEYYEFEMEHQFTSLPTCSPN